MEVCGFGTSLNVCFCYVADCDPFGDFVRDQGMNATTNCQDRSYSAQCSFDCDDGYHLEGDSAATFECRLGPQWESVNEMPQCVESAFFAPAL